MAASLATTLHSMHLQDLFPIIPTHSKKKSLYNKKGYKTISYHTVGCQGRQTANFWGAPTELGPCACTTTMYVYNGSSQFWVRVVTDTLPCLSIYMW